MADDPKITKLLKDEHDMVVAYVNQVVGTATETLTTVEARYKDAPIIDLITKVQEDVGQGGAGGDGVRVAAGDRRRRRRSRGRAEIPAGEVTIRDLSGLYVYDNTLEARLMTGAQIKAYLEYSAQYFVQTAAGRGGRRGEADECGRAVRTTTTTMVSGLTYEIDIAKPAGSRIKNLSYERCRAG